MREDMIAYIDELIRRIDENTHSRKSNYLERCVRYCGYSSVSKRCYAKYQTVETRNRKGNA